MGARQAHRGDALASAGALMLVVSLWLPWYSFHLGVVHLTAWQAYTTLPTVLVVCALLGGGLSALSFAGRADGTSVLTTLAGVVAGVVVVFRLIAPPLGGLFLHPTYGLFVALAGALAVLAGGWAAGRETRLEIERLTQSGLGGPAWPTIGSLPPPSAG